MNENTRNAVALIEETLGVSADNARVLFNALTSERVITVGSYETLFFDLQVHIYRKGGGMIRADRRGRMVSLATVVLHLANGN